MSGAYLTNLIGGKYFLGLDVFNKHVFTKVHESDVNCIEFILNACKVWRRWPDNIAIKISLVYVLVVFVSVLQNENQTQKEGIFL